MRPNRGRGAKGDTYGLELFGWRWPSSRPKTGRPRLRRRGSRRAVRAAAARDARTRPQYALGRRLAAASAPPLWPWHPPTTSSPGVPHPASPATVSTHPFNPSRHPLKLHSLRARSSARASGARSASSPHTRTLKTFILFLERGEGYLGERGRARHSSLGGGAQGAGQQLGAPSPLPSRPGCFLLACT